MINLLPPKEKEELLLEKDKNLAMVLGIMALVCLICLALVLFFLKFYVIEETRQQKAVLENFREKYKSLDFLSLGSVVKKYNADLAEISDFYKKEKRFGDALKVVFDTGRPDGLRIENIFMEKNKESDKVNAAISGISDNRENLLRFKNNMENNQGVENVYFPPDNWIKEANINFHSTFTVNLGE